MEKEPTPKPSLTDRLAIFALHEWTTPNVHALPFPPLPDMHDPFIDEFKPKAEVIQFPERTHNDPEDLIA